MSRLIHAQKRAWRFLRMATVIVPTECVSNLEPEWIIVSVTKTTVNQRIGATSYKLVCAWIKMNLWMMMEIVRLVHLEWNKTMPQILASPIARVITVIFFYNKINNLLNVNFKIGFLNIFNPQIFVCNTTHSIRFNKLFNAKKDNHIAPVVTDCFKINFWEGCVELIFPNFAKFSQISNFNRLWTKIFERKNTISVPERFLNSERVMKVSK